MKIITYEIYREKLLRVHKIIQAYLADGHELPPLEVLAAEANLSPYHFHRIFKGMTGESLGEHVRRLRLERAAAQLKFSEQPIIDIAMEAGYSTHESFTRAFAGFFGFLPSQYRSQNSREKKGNRVMEVTIKNISSRYVISVRHIGPYAGCGRAWESLCRWAGQRWLIGPGTQFLGLSYDDPEVTAPDKIRYDACITIKKDTPTEGEIFKQEIPAGDYACLIHTGPLEGLHDKYQKLCGNWLPHSGRELRNAPSVEIYLNDPNKTPPDKIKVEIQLPLV